MEEEISLREIIETVWNGKWIITVVTVAAMIISGILSFFVLPPTYEATSLVRFSIPQVEGQTVNINTIMNSFTETTKSGAAINRIISKLQLDKKGYTVSALKNAVQVQPIKDTNVIRISVKGKNAEDITLIANLLAFELGARAEISDRAGKIVNAKNELIDVEEQIKTAQSQLADAQKQLSATPEKLITKKSLASDPYLQSVIAESTGNSSKNSGALQLIDEEINPLYTALTAKISDVQLQLTDLNAQKANLQNEISVNEQEIAKLETQIENEKLKSKSSERLLSGFNAVFITPALQPNEPVGPKKLLNIAIAAVVGAMLSVLAVFLRQYWISTSKPEAQLDKGMAS
ncbi:MAG TPA: Wzz/FepE/Etk N-terminal domain-containing protein [Bacilli bacterium]